MKSLFNVNDQGLEEAAQALLRNGTAPDQADYLVLPAEYYHRQAYATSSQGTFTFWSTSSGSSAIVSNWNQGGVPQTQAFILMGIRFAFDPLLASSGARITGQDCMEFVTAATSDPIVNGNEIRDIFSTGLVNFSINNRTFINNAYGLNRFPAGNGPSFDMSFAVANNTAAPTINIATGAVFNNGAPLKGNEWRFPFPIAVPYMTPVTETVSWGTALSSTIAWTLRAEMFGVIVQAANR